MMSEKLFNKSWTKSTLGEVAEYLNGRAFKPSEWEKNGDPIIRIQNLNNPDGAYNYSSKKFEDRYKVVKGDLLFAWAASLGVYIWNERDAWLNQHIFKVVPKPFVSKYFLYYLLEAIIAELYSKTHGSAMVHITKGKFEATEIHLPPLPEQHRIVAKIEELFSELDKGIETLKTAKQQLKVYRQAVLKYAFEGKLTNPDVKDGKLPEGWVECDLKNLSKLINGDRGKNYPNRNEYVTIGIPFINTGHIEPNGRLDQSSMHYITREKFNSLNSGKIKTGDLVYCLRGATMGKTAIIEQFDEGAIASSLVIIRVNEKAFNKYIYHFLVSPSGRDLIKLFDNGTAQPNLSANSLSMFSIPLPSVDEQKYIVSEIESRLSVCDKIEESIEQGLQQAEALKQSILKKAFEGKLVPQDPNDEPASVLLERIKAERNNAQPEKKTRTKKVKA